MYAICLYLAINSTNFRSIALYISCMRHKFGLKKEDCSMKKLYEWQLLTLYVFQRLYCNKMIFDRTIFFVTGKALDILGVQLQVHIIFI
jgi:hypothetical protein